MKTVNVKTIRLHIKQCRAEIADLKRELRESVRLTKNEYESNYPSPLPEYAKLNMERDIKHSHELYYDAIMFQRAEIEALEELLKEVM